MPPASSTLFPSGESLSTRPPSFRYSLAQKALLCLPCVRQIVAPRRNLIAGPYVGEFGYELMQWQGFIRERRRHYQETHVLTYPGREYLYEGCTVHSHGLDLKFAGYRYGRLSPEEANAIAAAKAREIGLKDFDIFNASLMPTKYHMDLFWRQDFRLLEEPPLVQKPYDIVFHFRAIKKAGPDPLKNYSPDMADELAARCMDRGISVACVGHPEYSYCPKNCPDHRNLELRKTVAAISAARAGVGEASGGMHLINACGRPTIIWGEGFFRVQPALLWNPFDVPIYVVTIKTWLPSPETVCAAIEKSLADLRRRTDDFSRPAWKQPPQRVTNGLPYAKSEAVGPGSSKLYITGA